MDLKTKEIYSEVYEILILLGDRFINKLPEKLFNLIKTEKLDSYNPQYNLERPLEEQNIKEESIDMIALFYLNYWCETEAKKNELKQIFEENESKYQKELREKYNPEDLFKNKEKERTSTQKVGIVKYKENILKRIINRIKKILRIK